MKRNIVIGVDPDCLKSGLAVYESGILKRLLNFTYIDFVSYCAKIKFENCIFVIEDGNLINGLYSRNRHGNKAIQHKISESVGANKQRATDLIEVAKYFGIPVIRRKPRKGNWANKKAMFEKVTGWKGRSNPETRSAAFFGYFEANK